MPISMRMSCTAISLRRLTPPPPHLRRSPFTGLRDLRDFRSGQSLVEVLVSILLLFIVFCSWAAMNNIQAVRKESFRYAAVEKAAGILDAMTALSDEQEAFPDTWYRLDEKTGFPKEWTGKNIPENGVFELWPGQNVPIGCSIFVSQKAGPSAWTNGVWCTVSLYDTTDGTARRPYASLKALLERQLGEEP